MYYYSALDCSNSPATQVSFQIGTQAYTVTTGCSACSQTNTSCFIWGNLQRYDHFTVMPANRPHHIVPGKVRKDGLTKGAVDADDPKQFSAGNEAHITEFYDGFIMDPPGSQNQVPIRLCELNLAIYPADSPKDYIRGITIGVQTKKLGTNPEDWTAQVFQRDGYYRELVDVHGTSWDVILAPPGPRAT